MPFSVIAGEEMELEGKKVFGRKFPWGVINGLNFFFFFFFFFLSFLFSVISFFFSYPLAEDEKYSDSLKLKNLLIKYYYFCLKKKQKKKILSYF